MAQRKDVFQSKVLQKLYPKGLKEENDPSQAQHIVEVLANKSAVKRETFQNTLKGDGELVVSAAHLSRRLYTVSPPPADYTGASITLPQPECLHSGGEAAATAGGNHGSSENTDNGIEVEGHGKRRRRKKRGCPRRRPKLRDHSSVDGEVGVTKPNETHPTHGLSVSTVDGDNLSKNKRRKLKKKRHKEKLRSLGLVPRATALEFTYQNQGALEEGKEKEEEGRSTTEVSQFLTSTLEIYLSDNRPPLPTAVVQNLLSSMVDGSIPHSVLKQLDHLMGLVQRKEAGMLAHALDGLHNTMSPEETTAVIPLFRYWITDILPMLRDAKERPSETQRLHDSFEGLKE